MLVCAGETQDRVTLAVAADQQDRHRCLGSLLGHEPCGVDPVAAKHLGQELTEVVVADGAQYDRLDPELRKIDARTGSGSGSGDAHLFDHMPTTGDRRRGDRPTENVDDLHAEAHDSATTHSKRQSSRSAGAALPLQPPRPGPRSTTAVLPAASLAS